MTKVTAPVVGATKLHHIEGAAKAVELVLSPEENALIWKSPIFLINWWASWPRTHRRPPKQQHVWSTGKQEIEKA